MITKDFRLNFVKRRILGQMLQTKALKTNTFVFNKKTMLWFRDSSLDITVNNRKFPIKHFNSQVIKYAIIEIMG